MKNGGTNAIEIVINGIKYASLKSACKAYNKNYNTVVRRIRTNGLSVEEALEAPIKKNHDKNPPYKKCKITVEGKTYDSIVDAAEAYNINRRLVYNRLRNMDAKKITTEDIFEVTDYYSDERKKERRSERKNQFFSFR